jgi:hypothetical protein
VNEVNYIVEDNGIIFGMTPMPELVREERVNAGVKGAFGVVVVTHSKNTVKNVGGTFSNCISQKNAPVVVGPLTPITAFTFRVTFGPVDGAADILPDGGKALQKYTFSMLSHSFAEGAEGVGDPVHH